MTGTKLWRLSLAAILGFGWLFLVPQNAYATCVNYVQSQAIAAAYQGDEVPTVHTMDTCSGDDVSYQIPIATTITFDGVQYDNIYATTNSVITFGRPDGTYWTYPSTPSISLYSMDWYPGVSGTSGLDILYSEGGFQLNLNMVPYGNYGAQPSTVNIIVAITNSGGISVAYSYQGPQYNNLRTGVRLHDGSIVSLEAWGATQIQPGNAMPTLQAEPVSGSITNPSPTPTPITPEQQQAQVAEATTLANDIANINNLIAAINGEEANEPTPEPSSEPSPEQTEDPVDPDVVVEPEIVTPEDPRFPDEESQTEPESPNPSPSSDTTNEENTIEDPVEEPSKDTEPQPEDIDQDPISEPNEPVQEEILAPSNNDNISNLISEEELKKLNKLISANDIKLLNELVKKDESIKQAVEEFSARSEKNKDAPMPYTIADAVTEVKAENLLSDPIGTLAATFTNIDLEVLSSPTEWGKDMTDDQREKAQEVIVPVIIASNIVAAAMTRRK